MTAADPSAERPSVLVVDDEERVVEAITLWLGDGYDVTTATGGEAALDLLDDDTNVVLLDRHMPEMSGDEVLDRIREQGYDCRVAMVTGVDPDFDIVDMPFDDYLTKPVDAEQLRSVVDRLASMNSYDQTVSELYSVTQTRAALEAELSQQRLAGNERYERLRDRQERLQEQSADVLSTMDDEAFADLF